jgi:hypothetical protein
MHARGARTNTIHFFFVNGWFICDFLKQINPLTLSALQNYITKMTS